jgi:hypothetical protein
MSNCHSCGQPTEYNTSYCTACLVASVRGKYADTSLAAMVRVLYPEYFKPGFIHNEQMSIEDVLEG